MVSGPARAVKELRRRALAVIPDVGALAAANESHHPKAALVELMVAFGADTAAAAAAGLSSHGLASAALVDADSSAHADHEVVPVSEIILRRRANATLGAVARGISGQPERKHVEQMSKASKWHTVRGIVAARKALVAKPYADGLGDRPADTTRAGHLQRLVRSLPPPSCAAPALFPRARRKDSYARLLCPRASGCVGIFFPHTTRTRFARRGGAPRAGHDGDGRSRAAGDAAAGQAATGAAARGRGGADIRGRWSQQTSPRSRSYTNSR
jgi:hypothetical protein